MGNKVCLKFIDKETYEKLGYQSFVHYSLYYQLYLEQDEIELEINEKCLGYVWLVRKDGFHFNKKNSLKPFDISYKRVCISTKLILGTEFEEIINEINQELN